MNSELNLWNLITTNAEPQREHSGCTCVPGQCACACSYVNMCARVCTSACVWERKTKDRADATREEVPIPLDRILTCTSGIRDHRASDYTTRAGTSHVSRKKRFRRSPTTSIVKYKHALRNIPTFICGTATKRLQGPPLSRKRCVRERWRIEPTAWAKTCPFPSTVCVCVCARARACRHASACRCVLCAHVVVVCMHIINHENE